MKRDRIAEHAGSDDYVKLVQLREKHKRLEARALKLKQRSLAAEAMIEWMKRLVCEDCRKRFEARG
jgi:hypothetical protein